MESRVIALAGTRRERRVTDSSRKMTEMVQTESEYHRLKGGQEGWEVSGWEFGVSESFGAKRELRSGWAEA
jgi:hypothetical protein